MILLGPILGLAQQITVLNEVTAEPVAFAIAVNQDQTEYITASAQGVLILNTFSKQDTLTISSHGFKPEKLMMSQITSGNVVYLEPAASVMEQIVISASKFNQRKSQVAATYVTAGRESVLEAQPQTSADLLQQTGQIFVQKSQQGGGSPMIRGFSTNRLLITVDGVRMNSAIFRGGNLQNVINIDPLSIERTEVVLGPGSVIYGSDAIGGVMGFKTLEARFSGNDSISFAGKILGRFASANSEQTGHLDFNIGTQSWAFASSITVNNFGNLRMGSHGPEAYLRPDYVVRRNGTDRIVQNPNPKEQVPTGYTQINLLQKIRYRPSEQWDFDLGLIYSGTSDFDRYDALTRKRDNGNFRNAEWYYGPQTWLMANLQTTFKPTDPGFFDRGVLTLAYQNFGESRNERAFNDPILYRNDEHVDAYTISADFRKVFSKVHRVSYGLDYVANSVESKAWQIDITDRSTESGASRYPDGSTWQSAALYGLYTLTPSEKLALQMGARYNIVTLDADLHGRILGLEQAEVDVDNSALTGSLGLVYKPVENWRFDGSFSTAFRAPNVDDAAKIFDPEPETVIVPNPDLKPEYAYTAELGVDRHFDNTGFISLTGYLTYLRDALTAQEYEVNGLQYLTYQDDRRRIFAIQNADQAMIHGFEIGGGWSPCSFLTLEAHYNIIRGVQESPDGSMENVRHVSPDFGDLSVIFEKGKWFAEAFAQYNATLKHDELAPSQQRRDYLYAINSNGEPYSPSWYVVGLRSSYDVNDSLTVTGILENITDQRYRTYSSGVAAAGRNLIIALSYGF